MSEPVVHCVGCGAQNPATNRFCGACGAGLHRICPACESENPPGFQFCGSCGQRLGPSAPSRAYDSQVAERRHLTVMFCDLVGSTALSSSLDPEDLRELIRGYQATCGEVIERFEGHVAQYLGDGILVYFGYPIAHEDDPRRAVHAGLGIVAAMSKLESRREAEGRPLRVRVGIHSGDVVTGEVGSGDRLEHLALGSTPNVAARLQAEADPNTVVVSAATHDLTAAYFAWRPMSALELKGISGPVQAFQALHEADIRHRFDFAHVTPLVARRAEVAELMARFEATRAGSGQVVLISGEPGLGKSRLVRAFQEALQGHRHRWLISHCSPYALAKALDPIIDLLGRLAGFASDDTTEVRQRRLAQLLARYDPGTDGFHQLLAGLLGLPSKASELPPDVQKERTLRGIVGVLTSMARELPVVLVLEDLHWADPSTQEFLTALFARRAEAPVLVLLTFRTGFTPSWVEPREIARITIEKLSRPETEELAAKVAAGSKLPAAILEQIVARTDGVPLFIEELTRMVLESGTLDGAGVSEAAAGRPAELPIPETLKDLLAARLDRLEGGKEVAQIGAAIGREFSFQVIAAVSALPSDRLDGELGRLVEAELLHREGTSSASHYVFRHALIQEAALASLLKSSRRQLHGRIAETLETSFQGTAAADPGTLARHWSEAGEPARSIPYFRRAGDQAKAAYANQEAIALYRGAIDEIQRLDAAAASDGEWRRLSAALHESLGEIFALTGRRERARSALRRALEKIPEGDAAWRARCWGRIGRTLADEFSFNEAQAAFREADLALGEHAEDHPERRDAWLQTQLEKIQMYYWQGELSRMTELTERVRPLVEQAGSPRQRTLLFTNLVRLNLRRDRFAVSAETRTWADALVAAAEDTADISERGAARFARGFVELFSGSLDKAAADLQAALELGHRAGNSILEIQCLSYQALLVRRRGLVDETAEAAARALERASAGEKDEYVGLARANLAWSAWRRGRATEAEAHSLAALDRWEENWPFSWTAQLPLMALRVAAGNAPGAVAAARSVLEPGQQRLPAELGTALEEASRCLDQGGEPRCLELLSQAITLAGRTGHL